MHYLIVSFTHKNTDIVLREKLALNDNKKREILRLVGSSENILESMAVSTCNRVEIITFCTDLRLASEHIINSLSIISSVSAEILEFRANIYEDSSAVHHLFSVAASLDSLVVGENQIAGQLKEAFRFANTSANAGVNISFLMHWAFKTAAKVKSLTKISKNPVSISSVAVAKAKEIYEKLGSSLGGMSAVVVGAGTMATLLAKHLIATQTNVIIVNRSEQKAKELTDSLGQLASYAPFSKLGELVNRYALIFVATSAPKAIITDEILQERDFKRYIFDICVPRNVSVQDVLNVDIYAVDDLDEIVQNNIALRQDEANEAYKIVNESVKLFYKAQNEKNSSPAIKALRARAKEICQKELAKAIKNGYLKSSDKEEARKLLHQVFKSFLHHPSVKLKDKNDENTILTLEYLFNLNIKKEEILKG